MARTLKQWRDFVRMKAAAENGPTQHQQSRMIGGTEFAQVSAVLDAHIEDTVERRKLLSQFHIATRYGALDMILSDALLGKRNPDIAIKVAEAAAGVDYQAEVGT